MTKTFICDISTAKLSQAVIDTFPKDRLEYVNSITDLARKKQSAFAWKLLEYALRGKNVSFLMENGKWICCNNSIFFSISHSLNFVTVAINENSNVGVDIEHCSRKILKISSKLTDEKNTDVDQLVKIWTQKESMFKCGSDFECVSEFVFDKVGNKYCITTCSDSNIELVFVNLEDIL